MAGGSNANANSSDALGRKLYWLNWILAAATVLIAITGVVTIWLHK
jgi:hypothetical protein